MFELIFGACIITIIFIICNRKGGIFYNKRKIEAVMHHIDFLTKTCDGAEYGKYIAYTYKNKNNNKFIVSLFKSIFGDTYYIYRWEGKEYKYVAKWKYNQYNLNKINNICFAKSFDLSELVEWATDY